MEHDDSNHDSDEDEFEDNEDDLVALDDEDQMSTSIFGEDEIEEESNTNVESSSGEEEDTILCDAGQPAANLLSMDYLTIDCASSNTRNDSVLELRIDESNQNFKEQELDEHEINIENLIDQIEADNFNRETPVYSGSLISIYEACVRLIDLTQSLNLDKSKAQNLLQEIRYFFPSDCRLPKTVSIHCVKCGAISIKSNEETCSSNCIHNDQHRSYGKIAELTIINVEYAIQRVAARYVDRINDYSMYSKQLVLCDIINGRVYRDLPSDRNHRNITTILYGDGAPAVTASNEKQLNGVDRLFRSY
ncbi:unnamed protein product [Rotaria sordida]|uniref:Uncharacterized protein n=1 Tax=Rotaria sordida TaxID=392033 RepID=A0A819RTZ9_9BILA|nr:unnamed protein product [Rotaria sordida]